MPSSRDSSGSSGGDAEEGPLGVSLRPLDSTARQALGLDEDEAGLIIGDIDNDSPLYEAGLRPGLAILSASYIPLKSVKDLEKAIDEAKAKGRDKILLAVRNGQRTQFVTPEITSSSED